jgi:Phosphate-starvation-inducible E family
VAGAAGAGASCSWPTLSRCAICVWVFVREIHDVIVVPRAEPLAVTVTRAVNSALFTVVVLELIRTIVARLEGGGFHLQPFLVIGIISATRDILTVGAELSLSGEQAPLTRTMTELASTPASWLRCPKPSSRHGQAPRHEDGARLRTRRGECQCPTLGDRWHRGIEVRPDIAAHTACRRMPPATGDGREGRISGQTRRHSLDAPLTGQ